MDLMHNDIVPDFETRTAFQMRLKFADNTIVSPTDIFEQVSKLVKDNLKEIRPKVGRIGELLAGTNNGASVVFTFGWYFRKAVEKLEQTHGLCTVQFDSEEISRDQMKNFIVKFCKKQAEKYAELSETITRDGLPEEFMDDD